jgi:hypothetical protein
LTVEAGRELAAHRGLAAARALFAQARAWYVAEDPTNVMMLAYLDHELGADARARAALEPYAASDSATPRAIGLLGVIAVGMGDSSAARRAATRLGADQRPYRFGQSRLAEARIRAALGQTDSALVLLTRGFREGLPQADWTHTMRELWVLKSNARYVAMVKPRKR